MLNTHKRETMELGGNLPESKTFGLAVGSLNFSPHQKKAFETVMSMQATVSCFLRFFPTLNPQWPRDAPQTAPDLLFTAIFRQFWYHFEGF